MTRFILTFLVILFLGVWLITMPAVKHQLSEPWGESLASISHGIMSLWNPGVARNGSVLSESESHFAVKVDAECNGVDATLVLWAAMLAFPARLRYKLIGLAIGFVTVQSLNLLRIITLYTVGQRNEAAFTWMHHNLWQGLMVLGVLLTFFGWLWLDRRHRPFSAGAGNDDPPSA